MIHKAEPRFIGNGKSEKLFLLVAAIVLLSTIGGRSLWTSEGRWAEIVREMFISGDFFHPTIGCEPYFDKPLLTYWVIAGFSALTGRLDEFIIRLPSVLAALVALACTIYLGKRLWSAQVGLLAGGLLFTSYGLMMYSNVASAETENLAAVMLAVAWYWTRRDRPGFVTFLVFYLIMFIGSHTKGLTAFVVPVIAVLPDLLRQRRWRWLLWPSHWLALVIGVCVYLAPFMYATLTQPGSYGENGLYLVFQENILRYFQPYDHKGPIYLYFGCVPELTLPWVPFFIGAIIMSVTGWKRKKLDYNTRWLLQAILMIFVFFTLSGSRRVYYILPILPFCILLMAVFLIEASDEIVGVHRERAVRMQRSFLVVTAILEATLGPVAIWFLVSRKGWELPGSLGLSLFVLGLAALLAGAVAYKVFGKVSLTPRLRTVWSLIVMATVLQGGFFIWQYRIFDSLRSERPFALKMKEAIASLPPERVVFWHRREDKTLFYMDLDPPMRLLDDEGALREFLRDTRPGIVISQGRYVRGTADSMLPLQPMCAETVYLWDSNRVRQKKLRAWLINGDVSQITARNEEADDEK